MWCCGVWCDVRPSFPHFPSSVQSSSLSHPSHFLPQALRCGPIPFIFPFFPSSQVCRMGLPLRVFRLRPLSSGFAPLLIGQLCFARCASSLSLLLWCVASCFIRVFYFSFCMGLVSMGSIPFIPVIAFTSYLRCAVIVRLVFLRDSTPVSSFDCRYFVCPYLV